MRAARMRSISECVPVRVTINSTRQEYGVWCDSNTNGVNDTGEETISSLDYASSLCITANSRQGMFQPRGTFEATTGHWLISLASPANTGHWLRVLPNGHVDRGDNETD